MERAKTVALGLLLLATLFLMHLVWVQFPLKNNPLMEPAPLAVPIDKEDYIPKEALIHFGDGSHTVTAQLQNVWPFYRGMIEEVFSHRRSFEPVEEGALYKLRGVKSIVFDLGGPLHGAIFQHLYGPEELGVPTKVAFNVEAREFLMETEEGIFRSDGGNVSYASIGDFIDVAESQNPVKFVPVDEAYQVASKLYIPAEGRKDPYHSVYKNELLNMGETYRQNLVTRMLGTPINSVNIIEESSSTLYVYGQKTLRMGQEELIYTDDSPIRREAPQLMASMGAIKSFLSEAMGFRNRLYFQEVEALEGGYRFKVNFEESGHMVLPQREGRAYLIMEVMSNQVRRVNFLYRTENTQEPPQEGERMLLTVEEIFERNRPLLSELAGGGEELLSDGELFAALEDAVFTFVDPALGERDLLYHAYGLTFHGVSYYFDANQGTYLLEDARGLD